MFTIARILCPTDFSEPSQAALDVAIDLARKFDAELELFHAQELPAYIFPDGVLPVSPDIVSELERSARAELERLAVRAKAAGARVLVASAIGPHDMEII